MKLFEFAEDSPLRIGLVAVLTQLKERIKSSGGSGFKTSELIELLRNNGIHIDQNALADLITKDPLKNIIQNINGNNVSFVGIDSPDQFSSNDGESDTEKTVKNMAKRAIK
jgi:hypothetical protein